MAPLELTSLQGVQFRLEDPMSEYPGWVRVSTKVSPQTSLKLNMGLYAEQGVPAEQAAEFKRRLSFKMNGTLPLGYLINSCDSVEGPVRCGCDFDREGRDALKGFLWAMLSKYKRRFFLSEDLNLLQGMYDDRFFWKDGDFLDRHAPPRMVPVPKSFLDKVVVVWDEDASRTPGVYPGDYLFCRVLSQLMANLGIYGTSLPEDVFRSISRKL